MNPSLFFSSTGDPAVSVSHGRSASIQRTSNRGMRTTTPPTTTAATLALSESRLALQSWNPGFTLSLPLKLRKKILDLKYVEMGELMAESWRTQEDDQNDCCHQRHTRKGPVTDILLWVDCFASMVSVLSTRYPDKMPQLMAYQQTIVKAHRTLVGDDGWITYDTCYRRKAAVQKSLDWGIVDFTIYNETLAGRGKSIPRCRHCLSEHHRSQECTMAPEPTPTPLGNARVQKMQTAICQLFNGKNGNRCHFTPCKFLHVCAKCRGNHPAAACRRSRRPVRRPRSRSPKK